MDSPVLDVRRFTLLRAAGEQPVDPEFVELVDAFLESSRATLEEMRAAGRERDRSQTVALAHRLKGASVLFGAMRLSRACADLEAAARQPEGQREGHPEARAGHFDEAVEVVAREIAAAAAAIEREVRG